MKNGRFETQAEIYQALLDGKKIKSNFKLLPDGEFLLLKEGKVLDNKGIPRGFAFDAPEYWSIYEEPKPKKKITLYTHLLKYDNGTYKSHGPTSLNAQQYMESSIFAVIVRTESKEIEVDDV